MSISIPRRASFLHTLRRCFLILGGIYVALVAIGLTPFVQRKILYMHDLKVPVSPRYDMPEKYDLAPSKAHNVYIRTADNETLGAWFVFADPFYATHKADLLSASSIASDEFIRSALRTRPTILFLHGNGGTRALPSRVHHYKAFSTRLRANVFTPDYRGFADSTGSPSEAGLTLDARAAWDWLLDHGASPENVLVVGSSLGTGVAVQFVSALETEQQVQMSSEDKHRVKQVSREKPRGVVLLAPFSSIDTLLDTYYICGFLPVLAPLRTFPYIASLVKRHLLHRFDTLAKVVGLNVPLLIVHAEDDWDIPHSHSQTLFDAFLEHHLPALPGIAGIEVAEQVVKLSEERKALRQELVMSSVVPRVGHVEVFSKDRLHNTVVYLRTRWGGHDRVGLVEGVQDYIADMFKIGQ